MGHADQERGEGFEDFQSIEIEFDCDEGELCLFHTLILAHDIEVAADTAVSQLDASKFTFDFNKYVAQWQERCGPVDSFRALQRKRRISTSSKITFGKRRLTG